MTATGTETGTETEKERETETEKETETETATSHAHYDMASGSRIRDTVSLEDRMVFKFAGECASEWVVEGVGVRVTM